MSANEFTAEFATPAAVGFGEQELIRELRAGSVEAFNYLIAVYHQPLYHLVFRMLGDPADAADTLQEVFLKIFRAAAQFEGKSSLKTWVYRIAVHEASNHRRWWRRHKRQETSLDVATENDGLPWADRLPDRGASPLNLAMQAESRRRVAAALESLPEPFRTVVLLREMESFGYEEIAQILGVRVGTVKSRLLRGRELLRRRLLAEPDLCRELGLRLPAPGVAPAAPRRPAAAAPPPSPVARPIGPAVSISELSDV